MGVAGRFASPRRLGQERVDVCRRLRQYQRQQRSVGQQEQPRHGAEGPGRDRAQAREDDARAELVRRKTVEQRQQAAFALEQRGLRRLAAAVVAASTSDRYDIFSASDDASRYERRDAIKERTVGQQTSRVEARRGPWLEARRLRRGQDTRVATAKTAATAAARALIGATRVRVDLEHRAADAGAEAARRQQAVDDAAARTKEAALGRRTARLTSRVTGLDLPLVAVDAYWQAAGNAPCAVPWWLLAGIGRTESRHGTAQGSRLDATGTTTKHILGVPLSGGFGVAAIPDTDGGRLDDDPVWDRAVGPMQFIPSTWARWATDDNGDGVADPHNLYDAAGAAANYLCFGRAALTDPPSQISALLSYNASLPYTATVLAAGHAYQAALAIPDGAPRRTPTP